MATLDITMADDQSSQEVLGEQLFDAVESRDIENVRATFSHKGINRRVLEAFHGYGTSILHFALTYRDPDIIDIVINAYLSTGTSVDPRDEFRGETPLHWAARDGNAELFSRLVQAGASLDVPDDNPPKTPFHAAANFTEPNCSPIVRLALEHQLQKDPGVINQRAEEPYEATYLHLAASNDRGDDVKWLLERGADPLMQVDGETAWDKACKYHSCTAIGVLALEENLLKHAKRLNWVEVEKSYQNYFLELNSVCAFLLSVK